MRSNFFFIIGFIAAALFLAGLRFATSAKAVTNSDINIPDPNCAILDQNTLEHVLITPAENNQISTLEDSASTDHRGNGVATLEILVVLISLAATIAAFLSAQGARKSAAMAERLAKAAIRYSLTPLNPEIRVTFDAAKQIPEGYHTTIDFHNSGNQTVLMHSPVWEAKPQNAVKASVIKVELCLVQKVLFELNHSNIPVFGDFTAKIHLRFALGNNFESAESCEGLLRFPIYPTLDSGLDAIEIPCKFRIDR